MRHGREYPGRETRRLMYVKTSSAQTIGTCGRQRVLKNLGWHPPIHGPTGGGVEGSLLRLKFSALHFWGDWASFWGSTFQKIQYEVGALHLDFALPHTWEAGIGHKRFHRRSLALTVHLPNPGLAPPCKHPLKTPTTGYTFFFDLDPE